MAAPIKISYRFLFPDGRARTYDIQLAPETGHMIVPTIANPAPWTVLDYNKCKHCPLSAAQFSHCPVALNLAAVADDFKAERSTEPVTVEVVTVERTYRKDLRLQEGLFGIFGLIMATSACPYFDFLRPMARFHLPFSTHQETTVRSSAFYLLKQYFVAQKGGQPDFNLSQFGKLYNDLEEVNMGIIRRIRSVVSADAEANSVIILDGFAKILSMQLKRGLQSIEGLFNN